MKKRIMYLLTCLLPFTACGQPNTPANQQTISRQGMELSYYCDHEHLMMELSAPTTGWVTVGFNDHSGIQGAYLLMGRIVNNTAEVVAHYTLRPGNYQPLTVLGEPEQAADVGGKESGGNTQLRFSLPLNDGGKYRKALIPGRTYYLIMAFSREDDFQHHSIMRTSVKVTLCP